MQLNERYRSVFGRIPILGMIHLAGDDSVKRALEELTLFEDEGVDGAIIENYHSSIENVIETLKATSQLDTNVIIGVNVLPNEYNQAFPLAAQYGADFIQLDHVAGKYHSGELDSSAYAIQKEKFPNIIVLGGVWPKYYHPISSSDLETDINLGMGRAEAIVVTGAGTGEETPFDKIKKFREIMGDHPLVIGAGLTPGNAYDQLCIADGAIVGTCLKAGDDTSNPVDRGRVREFMSAVKRARAYQENLR